MTEPSPVRPGPWRFSLATMLLVVTIACLATALIFTSRRLDEAERRLDTLQAQPSSARALPLEEVARQFEQQTTQGPIVTTVEDVRYSPDQDSFKVRFSWIDPNTQEKGASEVVLQSGGYGEYYGQIRGTFAAQTNSAGSLDVFVSAPSGFDKQ